jgi:hypothetical protein
VIPASSQEFAIPRGPSWYRVAVCLVLSSRDDQEQDKQSEKDQDTDQRIERMQRVKVEVWILAETMCQHEPSSAPPDLPGSMRTGVTYLTILSHQPRRIAPVSSSPVIDHRHG